MTVTPLLQLRPPPLLPIIITDMADITMAAEMMTVPLENSVESQTDWYLNTTLPKKDVSNVKMTMIVKAMKVALHTETNATVMTISVQV